MFNHIRETANTFIDSNNNNNTSTIVGSQAHMITDSIQPEVEKIANSFKDSSTELETSTTAFSNSLEPNFKRVFDTISDRMKAIDTAIKNKKNDENWNTETAGSDIISHTYSKNSKNIVTQTITFNGTTSTIKYDDSNNTTNNDDDNFDLISVSTNKAIELKGYGYDLNVTTLSFNGTKAMFKATGTITGSSDSFMNLNALDISLDIDKEQTDVKFLQNIEAKFDGKIVSSGKILTGVLTISEANKNITLSGAYNDNDKIKFDGKITANIDIDDLKDMDDKTDWVDPDSLVMITDENGTKSFVKSYTYTYNYSNQAYSHTFTTQNNTSVTCTVKNESIQNTNRSYIGNKNTFSCPTNVKVTPYYKKSDDDMLVAIVDGKEMIIESAWTNWNYNVGTQHIDFKGDNKGETYISNNKLMLDNKEITITDIKIIKQKGINDIAFDLSANGTLTHNNNKIKATIGVKKDKISNTATIYANNIEISSDKDFVKIAKLEVANKLKDDNNNHYKHSSFENYTYYYDRDDNNDDEILSFNIDDISVNIIGSNNKALKFDADVMYSHDSAQNEKVNFNGTYSYDGTSFKGIVDASGNKEFNTVSFDISGIITPKAGFIPFSIAVAGSVSEDSVDAYGLFTRGVNDAYKLGIKVSSNDDNTTTIQTADSNGVVSTTTESDSENTPIVFESKSGTTLATYGKASNGNDWEIIYSDNSSETLF
jgi:hypothetical protein